MAIPKGNFIAYQPLTPQRESTPNKVPDLVSNMIDNMIKEGKAAEAARLKRLADEGARMDEIAKGIKIDPVQTIAPLQNDYNNLYVETSNAVAEYRMLSNEAKLSPEGRAKYQKMQNMVSGYKQLSTLLSSEEERKLYLENLKTPDNEVFQGDTKLSLIKSMQLGAARLTTDDKGNLLVQYKDLNDKFTDESRTMPYSEFATSVLKPFEKDTFNEFEEDLRKEAQNMVFTSKDGKGGVRITETEIFDRDKGELSFTSRFGNFDINAQSISPELKHFAYRILPHKQIQSEEDWDTVKKAYVDKLGTYVKESNKVWDTETALDRQQQIASIAATNRSNRGTANSAPKYSFVGGATLPQKAGDKSLNLSNGTIINLDNKEQIVGYNYPVGNKVIQRYYIVGTDQNGRMVIEKPTTVTDVQTKLQGYGADFKQYEELVKAAPIRAVTNLKNQNDFGTIKYDGAYKPSSSQGDPKLQELAQRLGINF